MSQIFTNNTVKPYLGSPSGSPISVCEPPSMASNAVPFDINWLDYGAVPGSQLGVLVNLQQNQGSPGATLDKIRSLYIDNTASNVDIFVQFADTLFTAFCPAQAVVFMPVFTGLLQGTIYASQFTANAIPRTRVFFLNRLIPPLYIQSNNVIVPGSVTLNASGNFTVPAYNTLRIRGWAGGAGGGSTAGNGVDQTGTAGGNTQVASLSLLATGGLPGHNSFTNAAGVGGLGQPATGGDTNIIGSGGGSGNIGTDRSGAGGNAPATGGGVGGAAISGSGGKTVGNNGVAPGGGGGGAVDNSPTRAAGGGASGAYFDKTYMMGQLIVGTVIPIIVGAGGAGDNSASNFGGAGAAGRIVIDWN